MMQSNIPRSLHFTQKLRIFAYNIKYKAVGILQEYPLQSALTGYQTAYLLGKPFVCNPANLNQMNHEFAQDFKDIIWITYRSGFPELLKDCGDDSSFITDTGWGCMIRVGQMLFAQILRDFLKPQTKQQYTEICNHFNDFRSDAIFSIQKIARLGKKQFNIQPGKWYNPAQIAYILSGFLNQARQKNLRNLKSIVFNNASLFFDQLSEIFAPVGFCKCQKPICRYFCSKCRKSERQIAVIILVRLGLDHPQPQYLQILSQMMAWRQYRGLLGGKPQKALYFVGMNNDEYIYLDPHYVQTAKEDITQVKNSYFCQSLRSCKNTSIDPSLGICFYLSSLQQAQSFYQQIQMIKKQRKQFFIYASDETPSYLQKSKSLQVDETDKKYDFSEQFQVIE